MIKTYHLILSLILFTSCFAQKTDLSLNLKKDEVYKQRMNSTATVNQEVNGQQMKMVVSLQGSMSYKVLTVLPTDYILDVQYDDLAMTMEMPQGKMEFRSDKNDPNDVFSTVLSKMIGQSIEIKMTNKGKILEVNKVDALFNKVFEDLSHISEEKLAPLRAQIEKAYGEAAFKGSIEMVTAIFPDKPMNIGDTWEVKTNLESGIAGVMTTEYVFTESNSDYMLITGNSHIKTADKDAYIEANGMPTKYDLKGTMLSTIKVDKETGWILEAKTDQTMQGKVHIKENPQLPQGLVIPMVMKNELVITN